MDKFHEFTPQEKELYRQAKEYYRQWNEFELRERVRNAGTLTPEKGWELFVDLVEFSWIICPTQSPGQRELKLRHIAQYHERVRRMEAWRQKHGEKT